MHKISSTLKDSASSLMDVAQSWNSQSHNVVYNKATSLHQNLEARLILYISV